MARIFRRTWRGPGGEQKTSPWYSISYTADGRKVTRQTDPPTSSARIAREQLHAALGAAPEDARRRQVVTIGKVLDSYASYLEKEHQNTHGSREGWIRRWKDLLGAARDAEDISPADIEEALAAHRRLDLKVSTISSCFVTLRSAFRRAIRDGLIVDDPTVRVRFKVSFPERHVVWTGAELEAVRAKASPWLASLLLFLRCTGVRIGDALSLRWDAISDGRLRLRMQKSGELLDVPLSSRAVAGLAAVGEGDGLVWPGAKGRRRAYNPVLRSVHAAMLGADPPVAGKTIHDLRRTFATELLEQGVSLELIAALLGQRSTRVAGRYTKARYEALRAVLSHGS